MKHLIIVIVIVMTSATTFAQFNVGVTAGGNWSNQRINLKEGGLLTGHNVKGCHAGVVSDLALDDHFHIQSQLLYARKGMVHTNVQSGVASTYKLHYVEVPLNVLYKFDFTAGKLFVGSGATFGYAFAGSHGFFKRAGNTWKREDLSLNFTGGFEWNNGLYMSVSSQKGLLDLNSSSSIRARSKSMSVSVGYLIDWSVFKRKS
jgi:hypothetical protein